MEQYNKVNGEEYIVDLREFFKVLKKNWIMFVVTAIICGLGGYGVSAYVVTPTYEASATMIVNTRQDLQGNVTYDQINSARNLVATYAVILKSHTVLQPIIDNLALNMSYKDFLKDIKISPIDDTQIMKISAEHKNKETAKSIVTEIVKCAPAIIMKTVKAGSVEVVSEAMAQEEPIFPNVKLVTLIASAFGLVLSGCIVFIRVIFNNKFATDEDIHKQLGIHVMGVIPTLAKRRRNEKPQKRYLKKKRRLTHKDSFIINENTPFKVVEAYKSLRTNLNFVSVNKLYKKIIVTSSLPGEGKSNTSINLAITLAQGGSRVILLDCDLRRPMLHHYLNLDVQENGGLGSILSGQESMESVIYTVEGLGIDVLVSTIIPPNPTELLGSKYMENLIKCLEAKYDYIICDTPPISLVTDAAVLSRYCDGVLLVVKQNYATFKQVLQAKDNLESVQANIVGVVLTHCFRSKDVDSEVYYSYCRQ
ncbi:MAG: polysaccharide biosynthesis tyrosine autokinase [Angelakisella sp.]